MKNKKYDNLKDNCQNNMKDNYQDCKNNYQDNYQDCKSNYQNNYQDNYQNCKNNYQDNYQDCKSNYQNSYQDNYQGEYNQSITSSVMDEEGYVHVDDYCHCTDNNKKGHAHNKDDDCGCSHGGCDCDHK